MKTNGYPAPPKVVDVTPDMATKWLEQNTHNRPIRQSVADRYARDMAKGRWRITHQGIAFDVNGVLIDGQHRLWAVVMSGATVPMLVHNGLPIESQEAIDVGAVRSLRDRLSLRGDENVPALAIATMKRMVAGVHATNAWTMTAQESLLLYDRHKEAITEAIGYFPGRRSRITTAGVVASIARAWYTQDRAKLKRFAEVLFSGDARTAPEKSVLVLRDHVMSSKNTPCTTYMRVNGALATFLADGTTKRVRVESVELWPLPGESEEIGKKKRYIPKTTHVRMLDKVMVEFRAKKTLTSLDLRSLGPEYSVKKALDDARNLGWIVRTQRGTGRKPAVWAIA